MKLFLISQTQNDGYGVYESAVVVAVDEEEARHMDPKDGLRITQWKPRWHWCCAPEHVSVQYLGEAAPGIGHIVVCASYIDG